MTENEFAKVFIEQVTEELKYFSNDFVIVPEVPRGSMRGRPGHFDAVLIDRSAMRILGLEFKIGNQKAHFEQCKKAQKASGITTIGVNAREVDQQYHFRYDYGLCTFKVENSFKLTTELMMAYRKERGIIFYNQFAVLLYYSYLFFKNNEIDYSALGTAAHKREMIPDVFRRACVSLFKDEGKVLSFKAVYSIFGPCVYSQSTAFRYYKEAVRMFKNE